MAITPDRLKALVADFMAQWHDGRDFIEAHTSGSTGQPKPIRLLKSDMLRSARATNSFFGIDSASRLLLALSPDYIAGKMMCVRAEAAGCRLDFAGVSSLVEVDEPTDLLAVVPAQLPSLIEHPEAAGLVRCLLVGGAAISPEYERALVAVGYKAWASYGMTETCSHVALRPLTDDIYRALPGISFSTDADSALIIEAPDRSFGRLATRDVVELLGPTSFRWLGRLDNVINSGGVKVAAEEVERFLAPAMAAALPGVEFCVCAAPSPRWGQTAALVVAGPEALLPKVRGAIGSASLSGPRRPGIIRFVDALPRTSSGKIIRRLDQDSRLFHLSQR